MKRVKVIGMGTGGKDLTRRHLEAINAAGILAGARRHLALFPDHPGKKIELSAPIADAIDQIRRDMAEHGVVVLATGDPLFYGIGNTLAEQLGEANVEVLPNVSIMAEAFARIKKSWAGARVVSLHGRTALTDLSAALAGAAPIFVFTDRRHTPAYVGQCVFEKAPERWQVCVLSRLGGTDEHVQWFAPKEAARQSFAEPNAVILWPDEKRQYPPVLGGPDENYRHDSGMITKSEVRVVSIARLQPEPRSVMWDLGAGSGAVAVESSVLISRGRIEAVEKNPARVDNIRQNIRKFGVTNISVHEMRLPAGMDTLPDPDRVFVGGGGEAMPEILSEALKRLLPGGRIVINAVVLETLTRCMDIIKSAGLKHELVQIQVAAGKAMRTGARLSAGNPVFILTAEKTAE